MGHANTIIARMAAVGAFLLVAVLLGSGIAMPAARSSAFALTGSTATATAMVTGDSQAELTGRPTTQPSSQPADQPATKPALKRISISKAKITSVKSPKYNGKRVVQKPVVRLNGKKLKVGRDYVVRYTNAKGKAIKAKSVKNAARYKLVVKGVGAYRSQKVVGFTIKRVSIAGAKVSKIADKTYTGGLIKPKPTVKVSGSKLKRGRDYTITYKANREIGQAKAIVKGKGNFRGKRVVTFNVVEWVSQLNVAKSANQIIVVEVHGTQAVVSLHVKSNGFFHQTLWTDEGWIGRNGLGDVYEGSGHTPWGVLYPDMAFGIYDDPGCKMGYTKADWSNWWCCDPESDLYNQWVSTYYRTDFNMGVSEHIISCGYAYNYCLNMGWNKGCEPYRGSAFFLHCSTGCPTAGCVSVPEWAMYEILRAVEPGCAIVIDYPEQLSKY